MKIVLLFLTAFIDRTENQFSKNNNKNIGQFVKPIRFSYFALIIDKNKYQRETLSSVKSECKANARLVVYGFGAVQCVGRHRTCRGRLCDVSHRSERGAILPGGRASARIRSRASRPRRFARPHCPSPFLQRNITRTERSGAKTDEYGPPPIRPIYQCSAGVPRPALPRPSPPFGAGDSAPVGSGFRPRAFRPVRRVSRPLAIGLLDVHRFSAIRTECLRIGVFVTCNFVVRFVRRLRSSFLARSIRSIVYPRRDGVDDPVSFDFRTSLSFL